MWSTMTVNVTGAFAIGVLMILVVDVWPPSPFLRPFLGTGVLGGYTTFSTAMLDLRTLLVGGAPGSAAAYLGLSLVLGLLAVWGGMVGTRAALSLIRRWHSVRRGSATATTQRPPEAS
jgi:CrcB protein